MWGVDVIKYLPQPVNGELSCLQPYQLFYVYSENLSYFADKKENTF